MTPEEFEKALKKIGHPLPTCPYCRSKSRMYAETLMRVVRPNESDKLGEVPVGVLVCPVCGHMQMHAIKILDEAQTGPATNLFIDASDWSWIKE